ncbi:energy transducer TonB [Bradyrhizobium sp. dw_411]|uniref:energy transducer TonB n=1 Tax=Bradyrhizobium sp. dw_411 TaxID=2720082 RepID=UPI001BCCEC04|nr:energy transducer TonB [Bradyrhizobium sp. dw_411]
MTFTARHDFSSETIDPEGNDPDPSSSTELLRLVLFPAIVGMLFIGGVYWLRLQVAAGGGAPESTTLVQVHLLPRPDPIPVPVAPATLSSAISVPNPTSGQTEAPAAVANQTLAALPTEAPTVSEPAVPSASQPSSDASSTPATLEFRNALLRHIARFQRYPRAAELKRLQGTVRAVFSVSRDGKLLGAWVKTSSGEAVLDQAAIETLRRAQPLPVIPSALPDPIKIELALGFDPP